MSNYTKDIHKIIDIDHFLTLFTNIGFGFPSLAFIVPKDLQFPR